MPVVLARLVLLAIFDLNYQRAKTLFVLLAVSMSFFLLGILGVLGSGFSAAAETADGARRLHVGSRASPFDPLPLSLESSIASVENVVAVSHATWFGGYFREASNQVPVIATTDSYFEVYREMEVDPWARSEFGSERNGILVGRQLAAREGWQVGQTIPLRSTFFDNGEPSWSFKIVGLVRSRDRTQENFFGNIAIMNWSYLSGSSDIAKGQVGWYVALLTNSDLSGRTSGLIDDLSVNSSFETRTVAENAALRSRLKSVADVEKISFSIIGASFFTLLLLTCHSSSQRFRERRFEFAVMRSLGFTIRHIATLIYVESIVIMVLGAALGLISALGLILAVNGLFGPIFSFDGLSAHHGYGVAILAAIAAFFTGLFPSVRVATLHVSTTLAGK